MEIEMRDGCHMRSWGREVDIGGCARIHVHAGCYLMNGGVICSIRRGGEYRQMVSHGGYKGDEALRHQAVSVHIGAYRCPVVRKRTPVRNPARWLPTRQRMPAKSTLNRALQDFPESMATLS